MKGYVCNFFSVEHVVVVTYYLLKAMFRFLYCFLWCYLFFFCFFCAPSFSSI